MDFRQIKLDGIDILQSGIIYTYVNWRKLSINDESRDIEGVHGRVTSPVYARYRIITIEGAIERLESGEEQKIKHLSNVFSLQSVLSNTQDRRLYVRDSFDNEWELNVKVKEPLELVEGDESMPGSHWRWRAVLESTRSPIYQSLQEFSAYGLEGNLGGISFDFNLGTSWHTPDNIIEVNTLSTQTYIRFEIDVLSNIQSPLMIYNITNNTFFGLDIVAVQGDKIVVDSASYSATKNGANIVSSRVMGSIWQKATGLTQFVLQDKNGNVGGQGFDVGVYFRNSLL